MIPKHTVVAILKDLRREITLIVYQDEEMKKFADEIASLSDMVCVKFLPEPEPVLGIPAIGFEGAKILFHGIPKHTELESFLTAMKMISNTPEKTIRQKTRETVIITFVSTFCPNCRASVDAVNSIAIKRGLEHHVVDTSYFPSLAKKYNIESVPLTIIGNFRISGAMTESEVEKWIEMHESGDYHDYFAEKLIGGEIEEVKKLVLQNRELITTLAELMSHREFIVRLGAMAAIEALHKIDPQITEAAKDVILKMMKHDDARIREDAAMMLGIIGNDEDIALLEEVAGEGGRVGDSAFEAIGNIKKKGKRIFNND
jgi:thiol-disulfide isomerase/thioredoxin